MRLALMLVLTTLLGAQEVTSPRVERLVAPVEIVNVGAVLPGVDPARAKEAIVLTGHYDSRATDVMDAVSDAPGADDDGSGTAMMLELARVMAAERPAVTVYFVSVAGEEQGLYGSAHLAKRLTSEGVDVLAMMSVDIAGNTEGSNGIKDNVTARLWSEGVPALETPAERRLRLAHFDATYAARRADCVQWQRVQRLPVTDHLVIPNVVPDSNVFALATVDAEGNEGLPVAPSHLE